MITTEALKYLSKKHTKITRSALIRIGKKYGFAKMSKQGVLEFDEAKMEGYFFATPPEGFYTVKTIEKDTGIGYWKIYNVIKFSKIPTVKVRGVMYVQLSGFVEKYKRLYGKRK